MFDHRADQGLELRCHSAAKPNPHQARYPVRKQVKFASAGNVWVNVWLPSMFCAVKKTISRLVFAQ